MTKHADAFGVDPGTKDRSFPYPMVSEASRKLIEFVSGEKKYASQQELAAELGELFHLGESELSSAKGSVGKVLAIAKKKLKERADAWKKQNPRHPGLANLESDTMRTLEELLDFAARQEWTPFESPPKPLRGSSCAELAMGFL